MADSSEKLPPDLSGRDDELRTLAATIGPDPDQPEDLDSPTLAPSFGADSELDVATIAGKAAASDHDEATIAPGTRAPMSGMATGRVSARGSASIAVPSPPITEAENNNPRYPLVKLIGEGGMGQIFLARQESLQREVAVKTIRNQYATNKLLDASFRSEALITGDLEHPNIIPVHEMGRTPDGRAYMAMKLVRGMEWADLIHPGEHPERVARSSAMTLRDHLDILVKICDAVAFAHSRNILHRDLKPRNVMVGEFGEVLVMDWGLALDISETPPPVPKALHRSAVRAAAGTPVYMSPELARPEPAKLGPPTDVYLLGAILYELLTGTPPHRGKHTVEILERAKSGEVEPPEMRAPQRHIPAELARIAMHALAADPAERPQTATAFRQELRDFLSHEESVRLAEDADRQLAELDTHGAVPREERYARYADALSRVGEALHLWPENALALRSRGRAALAFADEALDRGDVGLAAAQVPLLDASPQLDQQRITAVRAALAAHASAASRRRLAVAMAFTIAFALYVAVGDRWRSFLAEEQRTQASERFEERLNAAWQAVRRDDLAGLAAKEQALSEADLAALPQGNQARTDLAFARAVLLWRRQRWEELLELATSSAAQLPVGAAAPLSAAGRAAAAGHPVAELELALAPLGQLAAGGAVRGAEWCRLARAAVLGIAQRRLPGSDPLPFVLGTGEAGTVVPLDITFDPTPRIWSARDPVSGSTLWTYHPVREGPVVWTGLRDAGGDVLLLSAGQVVRVESTTGRVVARGVLRQHPILAWPDPLDREQLVVLVADDATSGGGYVVGDHHHPWIESDKGGVYSGTGSNGVGCGRVREVRVTLEPAIPAPADDDALRTAIASIVLDTRAHAKGSPGQLAAAASAERRERLNLLLQDPTDAHLALQALMRDARKFGSVVRKAIERRALGAARRAIPEEQVIAAWMLEEYGLVEQARGLYDRAAARFLAGGANPELGESSWVAETSRSLARRAISKSPQRAQELVTISLAFAVHHRTDLDLEKEIGERLAAAAAAPGRAPKVDYDHPELRGPATDADFVLEFWDMSTKQLAALAALAAIYLALALARKSAGTRRADLHARGMRSTAERAAGFFTRPFDRLRHVSLAYATRFERLVLAGAGATFLVALGASAAAGRMDHEMRVVLENPATSVPGGGDILTLLEKRHARGGSPAVLRMLAENHRARGDREAARAALSELESQVPGDARCLSNRGVLEEEAGGNPDDFYARAAAGAGEGAAAARWNRARRKEDAAACTAIEAELSPAARRAIRALGGNAPLWLGARHADLQAAAYDAGEIRHQMVAGVLRLLFQPGVIYGAVHADVKSSEDVGLDRLRAQGIAAAIAVVAMGITYTVLLASVLALIWLPLPVRGLYEPIARPDAVPRKPSIKRRVLTKMRGLGRGMLADFVYFLVGLADVALPGLQDLADGRAAAGVLKLLMVLGASAVGAVADETLKYNGSAIVAALTGGQPPMLALVGELSWSLVWLVYLTNLVPAIKRLHRVGLTRLSLIAADLGLMPAHLLRFLAAALNARRPLHEAVRAYAADHAMVLRDRREAEALAQALEAGEELPAALARFPLFAAWVARAAAWGRAADRLPEALSAAAELLSRERRLFQKIRRAMLVPLFQAGIIVWFGAFTVRLVAPPVADAVRYLPGDVEGGPMGTPLRLIAFGSECAWIVQIVSLVVFAVFAAASTGVPMPGRKLLDRLSGWLLPPRRRALAALRHATAARLLAFALRARISLPEALHAVADAVPDAPLNARLRGAARRIEHGEAPAQALAPSGERDGVLLFELAGILGAPDADARLRVLADRLFADADTEVERLPAVLVPVMTLITGLFVLISMGSIVWLLSAVSVHAAQVLLG